MTRVSLFSRLWSFGDVGQPTLAAAGFQPALAGIQRLPPAAKKPPKRRLQARLPAPQHRPEPQAALHLEGDRNHRPEALWPPTGESGGSRAHYGSGARA